jgi:hypothetical protein
MNVEQTLEMISDHLFNTREVSHSSSVDCYIDFRLINIRVKGKIMCNHQGSPYSRTGTGSRSGRTGSDADSGSEGEGRGRRKPRKDVDSDEMFSGSDEELPVSGH